MAPEARLLVVPGKSPTSLDLSLFTSFLPLALRWVVLTIKGKDGREGEHPVLCFARSVHPAPQNSRQWTGRCSPCLELAKHRV